MITRRKRTIKMTAILLVFALIIVGCCLVLFSNRPFFSNSTEIDNISLYKYDHGEKRIIECEKQENVQRILGEILVRNIEKQFVPFATADMDYLISCMYKGTAVDVYIGKESFINVVKRRTVQYEIRNPEEVRQKLLFIENSTSFGNNPITGYDPAEPLD